MKSSPKARFFAAFTVIELMIVVSILALLMGISFSAFNAAVAQSKISRTKVIIAKLDQLLMERYESYRTRPVPINVINQANANTYVDRNNAQYVRLASRNRLYALREIMRMEMPGMQSDVTPPTSYYVTGGTAISRGYIRRVPASWSPAWEHAECLYLIISSMRDGDKAALDFFTPEEIGDTDADGVPEILDAWGMPIQFIRWAPGYRADATPFPALSLQNSSSPDSFDRLKADQRWDPRDPLYNANFTPYDLKPLIYSFGPDKAGGISLPSGFSYANTTPRNDPYHKPMMAASEVGGFVDANAARDGADNITNHYQEAE